MRHILRRIIWCACVLYMVPSGAQAQYMYLDVDGDGVNTSADVLNAQGATLVTVYLNTNHDKDGSLKTCNSHTAACGASTTTQALGMFSYTISLVAVGGTVQWGTFTPANAAYAANGTDPSDYTSIEVNRLRPAGTFTPPGLSILGSIPVTILSGTPRIDIAHSSITANPFGFGTGFGTSCDGFNLPHTYALGDPANPCGSGGDWFDADGVASSGQAPRMAVEGGTLYMGGVLLKAPYDMTFVDRRLTINGYQLPQHPRAIPTLTTMDSAKYDLVVAAMALKDRLLGKGLSTTDALPQVRAFVISSPLVRGAEIKGSDVEIQFGSGGLVRIPVVPAPAFVSSVDAKVSITEGQTARLKILRDVLERGGVVFLLGGGREYVVGWNKAQEITEAIARMTKGEALTTEQEQLLPTFVREQLLSPAVLDSGAVGGAR